MKDNERIGDVRSVGELIREFIDTKKKEMTDKKKLFTAVYSVKEKRNLDEIDKSLHIKTDELIEELQKNIFSLLDMSLCTNELSEWEDKRFKDAIKEVIIDTCVKKLTREMMNNKK